ncbi:MAG: glycosyltransferase [Candidatus Buchananbacteria bacterium]|nr:glycosyltransferase [Candidatus Buchananbacteria bacterium]
MSSQTPKISVIMPFYNAAAFLAPALESILNQTFRDFELILINDASTDNSDQIVQRYLTDQRIIYIKNKVNQGIVFNLNLALQRAQSEIIARMDGDDVCEPDRFAKQYEFLQQHPEVAAVGSFIKIIDENGKIIDQRTKPVDFEQMKKKLLVYSPVVHASLLYRKSAVLALGGYRDKYLYCEDIDLFYRLVYSGHILANIPEFLYYYRYHHDSVAHRSKLLAKKMLLLRHETITSFSLKVPRKQWLMIYLQYFIGIGLSGRQRQMFEGWYKKIFYHGK